MERKRRMRGYIVVCLLFALLMSTGCTSAQQDFSSEERPYPDENMTVIGVSQLGSESMWRSAIRHRSNRCLQKRMVISLCTIMPGKSRKTRLRQYGALSHSRSIILFFHRSWRADGILF